MIIMIIMMIVVVVIITFSAFFVENEECAVFFFALARLSVYPVWRVCCGASDARAGTLSYNTGVWIIDQIGVS